MTIALIQTVPSGLTRDAWATLVAAFIGAGTALIVVIVQRCLEWRDRKAQQAKERRNIARALVFEIVNFLIHFEKYVRPRIEGIEAENCLPPIISAPSPQAFAVYRGNARSLGDFEQEIVEAVVRFYGLGERFLATLRDYSLSLDQELTRLSVVGKESAPRRLLKQMQELMPHIQKTAIDACKTLCTTAEVSYETLRFGDN